MDGRTDGFLYSRLISLLRQVLHRVIRERSIYSQCRAIGVSQLKQFTPSAPPVGRAQLVFLNALVHPYFTMNFQSERNSEADNVYFAIGSQ